VSPKQIVAVGHTLDAHVLEYTAHERRGGIITRTVLVRLVNNACTAEVQGWQRDGWEHMRLSGSFPNGRWVKVAVEHQTEGASRES